MSKKIKILTMLVFVGIIFSGCMTNEAFLRVDQITRRIEALQVEAANKVEEAKTGEMTIPEALEWTRDTGKEIAALKDELRGIKTSENVGWAEVAGAALVSLLGGTGLIRAWRGPSHKNTGTNATT